MPPKVITRTSAPSKAAVPSKKTFEESLREADDRERDESLAELLGGASAKKPSTTAAPPPPPAGVVAAKRVSISAATPSRARAPVESKAVVEDDVQALDPEELAEEVAAFGLDLGELDLTSQDIALDEVDDDLQKFQKEEIVREALEKGVDLRNYSWTIEAELRKQEAECIRAYVNESDNLASLHNEITHCDNILATMETMLTKFQDNLGEISTEIKALQDKSVGMNIKLRNRVSAGERLSSFVKEIQVSDELQKSISESPVGEPEYIAFVEELSDKVRFLSRHEITNSKAARDVAPKVDRLKAKAISRISHFLLAKFGALKKPGVDVKDKRKFIKLAPLYQFLVEHARNGDEDIAAEVRRSYMDVLSKLYLAKFKTHFAGQKKLVREEKEPIVKTDLIAMDEAKTGVFSTRRTNEKAFLLGSRDSVLSDTERDVIDPVAATTKGVKYPYERLFRSSLQFMLEHAAIEFEFLAEFFGDRPAREEKKSIYDVDDSNSSLLPDDLMKSDDGKSKRKHRHRAGSAGGATGGGGGGGPLDGAVTSTTSTTEDDSEDEASEDEEKRLAKEAAAGGTNGSNGDSDNKDIASTAAGSAAAHRSFVMASGGTAFDKNSAISAKKEARRAARGSDNPNSTDKIMFSGIFHKTNQLFQEDLEGHLLGCHDLLGILILIRINHTLQQHPSRCLENFCHRIEAILWPKFKHVFEAHMTSINTLKAAAPKKLTTKAHFVTVRYGELCAGIHRLNRGYDNPMLVFDLKLLRTTLEKLLQSLRSHISGAKNQSIFLINNYYTILRILKQRGVDNSSDDLLHFVEVSNQEIRDGFAKLEFNDHFPKMMQWLADVHDAKETKANDVTIEAIVKHFGKNWRDNVEKINNSVLKNFDEKEPGGRGGTDDGMIGTILKIVYAELVGAAQALRDAIDRFYPSKKPSFYADLVPQTELIHHMRKYNRGQEEEETSYGGHDEEELPDD